MRNRLLISLCATTLLAVPVLGAGCGNSDDDNNSATPDAGGGGTKGGGSGSDSGTGTGPGTGTGTGTTDSGTGTGTGSTDSGTGKGGGGGTVIKSSCTPANVTLGVETLAKLTSTMESIESIGVADLNGDGATDLIGVGQGLDVALSNKDGTFGAPKHTTEPVGNGGGIIGGDFDGDGVNDIVVGSFGSGSVDDSVDFLAGKGDGTFKLPVNSSVASSNLYRLLAADFNADGKLDIYFYGQDGQGIALNTGGGTFAGASTFPQTITDTVAFADLNGDKAADIVYYDANQMGICVGLNNGTGTLTIPGTCYPLTTGTGSSFIQIGDLNADGILDIVSLDENGDSGGGTAINVYIGKSGGTYNDRVPYGFSDINSGLVVTDVNNDGRADVEVAETYGTNAQLTVFLANADGTLPATASATYPFGSPMATSEVPFYEGDFAGNGLHGFVTLNDLDGNENVLTATCKQ